jgi:hypothetical protein
MNVVEGGASVGTANCDKLAVIVCGTLGSGLVGIFKQVDCFLAGYLSSRVSDPGLLDAFSAISRNASGISVFAKLNFGISNFGMPQFGMVNEEAACFVVLALLAAVVVSVMTLNPLVGGFG